MEWDGRRSFLRGAAVAGMAAGLRANAAQRYQLGCMTSVYGRRPMARALEGIRKAGFASICPGRSHADLAFTAALPAAGRAELKRLFASHELKPILSLGGFGGEVHKPEGYTKFLGELDLCAEFGIPVMVGGGPWYFQKFPNLPKRARDWDAEVAQFYTAMEKAVAHAEKVGVTIALKPHTGITATAKSCIQVANRIRSDRFKICWDAGNVSFYEGIYPDPDLPDLAPYVRAVCIKDHRGGRAEANFPVPGSGQIDHELMFRTLFGAGFDGPMSIELLNGRDQVGALAPETMDERAAAAFRYLTGVLDRIAAG
jgi:sugar phosphate isomerase/epimerase